MCLVLTYYFYLRGVLLLLLFVSFRAKPRALYLVNKRFVTELSTAPALDPDKMMCCLSMLNLQTGNLKIQRADYDP